MSPLVHDVVIVGAGAAGLATAIFAARSRPETRIVLLDGARLPGAKILVSGGGRCNVTNAVVTERDFNGGSPAAIRRVLRGLPVDRTVAWFAEMGVPLHEEALGKLFPDSHRAQTVLDALLSEARARGVDIRPAHRVAAVQRGPDAFDVRTASGSIEARAVVLATGGLALPKSGSDGAGYEFAKFLGHSIVPTTPALAPLLLEGDLHGRLQGVAHEAMLTLALAGARPRRIGGSLLWTHFGISGPAALDMSRHWLRAALDDFRTPALALSIHPFQCFEAADRWLREQAASRPRAQLATALGGLLPDALAAVFVEAAQARAGTPLASLTRENRRALAHALSALPLAVCGSRGYTHAEATAGGVSLGEVDPATMASRRCAGLFLVGEVLDVDGRLGGFNFQWAWSSAFVAARGIAAWLGDAGAGPGGRYTAEAMRDIEFTLNGQPRRVAIVAGESLLEVLRNRCGTRSVKDGCAPQGQCGCCLALVDGAPKTTCAVAAETVQGKSVLTLEGVPAEERDLTARAFAIAAGVQCGFCIPGIALRAKWLLDRQPRPSRREIAKAIDGNLCRCTGYVKIVDAIDLLARARQGEPLPPLVEDGGVGASLTKYRAEAHVLGLHDYVADLEAPGMLHGAVTLSPHARARVLRLDTRKAEALDGVVRVATAADVPGDRWYGLLYADWPGFVAVGEEVRCVGDVVAAVAAVDERTARAAAALVEVDYEPLPPVLDPEAALAPGAPRVNPRHENLLSRSVIRRGDAESALAASAHVVSGTWHTQRIEHLFLEPESAFAEPLGDGRLRLRTQGQGIFDDRRQVAAFLGVPETQVDVELVPNGGAFGGKEDMSVQSQAALLAWLTGRPVRLTLSREESIRLHPKRHPISMHYTVGCDADGRLTAVRARLIGDSGAYASVGGKVLERAAGHACGPYRVPAVDVEARAAYTNNPPCGAMRGFGANQAHFAIEGCMDLLARATGLDRWEIRWRNGVEVGDTFGTGQVLEKSVGLKQTLQAVKPHYDAAVAAGRAVGIACGVKNSGIGNGVQEWGKARLVVEADGTVSLYNGYTEMGQGLLTVLVQFAAEVTGLPASVFRPKVDSTFALGCGQTTGSRATLFGGRAVTSAARKLRADLDAGLTLGQLAGRVYAADIVVEDTTPLGADVPRIKTHTSFGYATQVVILDAGGRVERVIAAHDVGRAVNPALCEGQVQGSVHMGLGYALTEDLPCEDGMPVTFSLREIGVLRARDMPEVEVILVEDPEPEGPFGAKGVGEIGLVPTAAAVAGALEAFDGTRRYRLPMKDSPAARAMSVGKIRQRAPDSRLQAPGSVDRPQAPSPKPQAP